MARIELGLCIPEPASLCPGAAHWKEKGNLRRVFWGQRQFSVRNAISASSQTDGCVVPEEGIRVEPPRLNI